MILYTVYIEHEICRNNYSRKYDFLCLNNVLFFGILFSCVLHHNVTSITVRLFRHYETHDVTRIIDAYSFASRFLESVATLPVQSEGSDLARRVNYAVL